MLEIIRLLSWSSRWRMRLSTSFCRVLFPVFEQCVEFLILKLKSICPSLYIRAVAVRCNNRLWSTGLTSSPCWSGRSVPEASANGIKQGLKLHVVRRRWFLVLSTRQRPKKYSDRIYDCYQLGRNEVLRRHWLFLYFLEPKTGVMFMTLQLLQANASVDFYIYRPIFPQYKRKRRIQ